MSNSSKFMPSERGVPCRRKEGRTDGQTDRYDESNSRFSQFFQRA